MFKLMKALSTSVVCIVDFIRLKKLESKSGFCFVLKTVSHWGAIVFCFFILRELRCQVLS